MKRVPYLVSLALLAYMPFHVFLAQWLSLATGGLDWWKVGKDILLLVVALFTICLVWRQGKGDKTFNWLFAWTVAYGGLHLLLWAANPGIHATSAAIGITYNVRLPLFLLLGYGAVRLLHGKFVISSVVRTILVVSTVVACLGLVQYLLPSDVMTHFGYGLERGTRATFSIDSDSSLPRIMSTLREPNALGAYLIVPSALLTLYILRPLSNKRRYLLCLALAVHLAAIFLTFSRSAWLGVFAAVGLSAWFSSYAVIVDTMKRWWPVAAVVLVVAATGILATRNTDFFERYVLHNNPQEQVQDLDSNDYHVLLLRQGLAGIADKPLGHGPGTAGLASIHNPDGGQLTENYYVQIGYEVGVLGLLLFAGLQVWLYAALHKKGGSVATALLAGFWAYLLTNMLLHTWSNEAVAAQWWILAGMVLGTEAEGFARGRTDETVSQL